MNILLSVFVVVHVVIYLGVHVTGVQVRRNCGPTEFKCSNGKCALMIWRCDGENDCDDESDEHDCVLHKPDGPCGTTGHQCKSGDQCIPASYQCDKQNDCRDASDEVGCSAPSIIIAPPSNIKVEIGGHFTIICEAVGNPTPIIVWRFEWGNIPNGERVHVSSVNGRANLTITDARMADSGIYTCEAINAIKSIFASPNTSVLVHHVRHTNAQDTSNTSVTRSIIKTPESINMSYGATVGASAANSNLIEFKK